MYEITFPLPMFRRVLHTLLQHLAAPVRCPVGLSQWAGHSELLAAAPGSALARSLLVGWTDTCVLPSPFPPECAGVLLLGRHQQRGHARGVVCLPGQALTPAHSLRLVGPGMLTVPLQQTHAPGQMLSGEEELSQPLTERWSRTIGALGLEVWQRLIHLRYAIIGLGRTGSRVAQALTHLGVRQLTLIDPDHLELHNLGEMASVTAAYLGRPKVEAVAAGLRTLAPAGADYVLVPTSMTRWPALHAAQGCDVLIVCVDHDSARLAATAVATLFCKPLLDIATGVHGHDGERQMGADIRLIFPGHCLLCCGGLRDMAQARQVLAGAEAEEAFAVQRDWRHERAGSLASLNQCAVGMAMRLLEDSVAARLQHSTWVRIEFTPTGQLTVTYPPIPPVSARTPCPLCRLTGWGQEGLSPLRALWRADNSLWHTAVPESSFGTEGLFQPTTGV